MIDVVFDMREFERAARSMDAALDQVPFALSQAMNDAVKVARREITTNTWPRSVRVRNRSFISAALRMEFADKRNLRVAIKDVLGRASLNLHAYGGTKTGRGRLAVPNTPIARQRGARGIPHDLKPRNLRNSFVRGDAIYQRVGKGVSKGLRLAYVLKSSVPIDRDVPFVQAFHDVMLREVRRSFPQRMAAAMTTRRPR